MIVPGEGAANVKIGLYAMVDFYGSENAKNFGFVAPSQDGGIMASSLIQPWQYEFPGIAGIDKMIGDPNKFQL